MLPQKYYCESDGELTQWEYLSSFIAKGENEHLFECQTCHTTSYQSVLEAAKSEAAKLEVIAVQEEQRIRDDYGMG